MRNFQFQNENDLVRLLGGALPQGAYYVYYVGPLGAYVPGPGGAYVVPQDLKNNIQEWRKSQPGTTWTRFQLN